jgi:catechol 2,3-dioxygenase-like lactoylglutathione lyase family enzyme
MPSPTRLCAIQLQASDPDATVAFYERLLGLPAEAVPEQAGARCFTLPDGVELVVVPRPDASPAREGSPPGVVLTFEGLAEAGTDSVDPAGNQVRQQGPAPG